MWRLRWISIVKPAALGFQFPLLPNDRCRGLKPRRTMFRSACGTAFRCATQCGAGSPIPGSAPPDGPPKAQKAR
ncbi:hypothetical protein L209DRAFT_416473 [Thermothelomyces heterothallicus CBS 203.75]